jgi:hypothetical protein
LKLSERVKSGIAAWYDPSDALRHARGSSRNLDRQMRVAEQGGFAGDGLADRTRLQRMRAGRFWGIGCLIVGVGVSRRRT